MEHPTIAFQDQIQGNHCFGCGSDNPLGLQIKSYWSDDDKTECRFTPAAHHCAGPESVLNGGIISTIIDCHCVCSAMAKAYQLAGRDIKDGERIWFATGLLEVPYLKPTPIDQEVLLVANIVEASDKKIVVSCELFSGQECCAKANVIAVKVPNGWFK